MVRDVMIRDVMVRDVDVRRSVLSLLLCLGLTAVLLGTLACGPPEEAAPAQEPDVSENAENAENTARDSAPPPKPELPEGPPIDGFQQFMPRGGIPALVDPQFVAAGEAEIPDSAWVMGFEHQGQAYAYDLNLLNHHEVVNHRIGELPVAAVW